MKTRKAKEKMYGNHIKAILSEKGMSPQELSDVADILPSHISRIINGKRRCISLPIAIKISQALGMPVESVFIYKKPVSKAILEDDSN
jgi:plasmid maintenance system antidote protein VapI